MLRNIVAAGSVALTVLLGAPAAQATAAPTAEQQLDWVVDASARIPLPDNEIREHIATVLLTAAGGPEHRRDGHPRGRRGAAVRAAGRPG